MGFLDNTGLAHFKDKLMSVINTKLDANKIVYSESTAPSNPTTGMVWLKKSNYSITDALVKVVNISAVSALPITANDPGITSDMVLVGHNLSNQAAQTGDWTITTANTSVTVSGTIAGTTNITLYLARSV